MLEDTVVLWTTESGRTPYSQGIKGGATFGESDEFSYAAPVDKTMCYDQHATLLHLLGYDHTRLTFRHNGAERRLTDVHGRVIREIIS